MTSTNPLYFIPAEIWLQVFSHLDEPDYLNLKRASPYLRNVVVDNAPSICNNLILTRYAEAASILDTTLRDGWLVPSHALVLGEEKRIDESFSRASSRTRSRGLTPPPHPTSTTVRTKLSEPGPQYLRFLVEYSLEIRIANDMFLDNPACKRDNGECTPQQQFNSWVSLYTVRRFLSRLHKFAGAGFESSFMATFKGEEALMRKGTEEGLAWFYT